MAQFEIIKDVSVSLTKLLTESFKEAGYKDIEVYNTLPTEENIKKLPAISLFMTAVTVDQILGRRLLALRIRREKGKREGGA